MKKLFALLGVVVGAGSLFAEGTGPDFSAATTALTGVSSALTTWVSTVVPTLGTIAAAFLVFWLGKMVFRLVKGWASSAK